MYEYTCYGELFMLSEWEFLETETQIKFGYKSTDIPKGCNKPIIVKCSGCGHTFTKRRKDVRKNHRCDSIINNQKFCFKCNTILDIVKFSKNKSCFDGYQKVCKQCFANYGCVKAGYRKKSNSVKNSNMDTIAYFMYKANYLRARAKKLNLQFNLTSKMLMDIYIAQEGKCYYTNAPLVRHADMHHYNSLSVDRLTPSVGYVEGNVVFCSFAINSMKGAMTEEQFKLYLTGSLPNLQQYITR